MDDDVIKTEIYCHACGRYVQFALNLAINGRHTVECPNCGHEHYRIVRNGRITEERWQSSSGLPIIQVNPRYVTTTATSTYTVNSVVWASGGTTSATCYVTAC